MSGVLKSKAKLAELAFENLSVKADLSFRRVTPAIKAGFDPDQPRDDDGKWSGGAPSSPASSHDDNDLIAEFVERARRLNIAGISSAMSRRVDLCLPILMRPSLGTDRNQWGFQRCLNACLGRMGA